MIVDDFWPRHTHSGSRQQPTSSDTSLGLAAQPATPRSPVAARSAEQIAGGKAHRRGVNVSASTDQQRRTRRCDRRTGGVSKHECDRAAGELGAAACAEHVRGPGAGAVPLCHETECRGRTGRDARHRSVAIAGPARPRLPLRHERYRESCKHWAWCMPESRASGADLFRARGLAL